MINKTAEHYLITSTVTISERGEEYDSGQERSFKKISKAFNAITGKNVTPAEIALIQQILKDVRQWSNPNRLHDDSLVDCVSYAALKAEELNIQFSSNSVTSGD